MLFGKWNYEKNRVVKRSLSRRFSYALTGVVTFILFAFSAMVILYDVSETEQRLQQQLSRTAELAETSLASAVWQLNPSSINDVLEAIFIDGAIVYASVVSDGDIIAAKTLSVFRQKDFCHIVIVLSPDLSRDSFYFFRTVRIFKLNYNRHYHTADIGKSNLIIIIPSFKQFFLLFR